MYLTLNIDNPPLFIIIFIYKNQKFNICGGEDISRKDIADFYSKAIEDKLKYKIIQPDNKFWEARPKDINITSIYFEILLGRKPIKIKNAINQIELRNHTHTIRFTL